MKKGHWQPYKYGDDTWHQCSACGVADRYIDIVKRDGYPDYRMVSKRNFCPNCGADMSKDGDNMGEKIKIEFTAEEIDKILEYQSVLQGIIDDDFLKRFPDSNIDTVQKAIMNAIKAGLCHPGIIV